MLILVLSAQWFFALQAICSREGQYFIIVGFGLPIFCVLFLAIFAISIVSRGLLRSGYVTAVAFSLELGLFVVAKFLGP